jgi:hypothetical protein
VLTVVTGSPAPEGFTLIGTTILIVNGTDHTLMPVTLDVFLKQ